MQNKVRFLGLDVHGDTIAVAVAEPDGEVRSLGTIANSAEAIRKMVKKLGTVDRLRACYEAGPTGYVLYWQLSELSVNCEVIAPTLVPMKAGDRVKTDRRDAERLARSHRSGDLTAVWVPDAGSEALRDLVRAREAAKQDRLRARHRLSKFLLRSGQRPAQGMKGRTRGSSQRQLPTDHDYATSTREYQTAQSPLKTAPTAAGPAFEKRQMQQKQPHRCAGVDGALHIRFAALARWRG